MNLSFQERLEKAKQLQTELDGLQQELRPELERREEELRRRHEQRRNQDEQELDDLKAALKSLGLVPSRKPPRTEKQWITARVAQFKEKLKAEEKLKLNGDQAKQRIAEFKLTLLLSSEYADQFPNESAFRRSVNLQLNGIAKTLVIAKDQLLGEAVTRAIVSAEDVRAYRVRVNGGS